jgi:hypothetical protein
MNKDTLYLIDSNQKFKTTVKDRLFYNKYQYGIGFRLDEANCLRELSHERIDWFIERRKLWREITHQRLSKYNNINVGSILMRREKEITDDTVKNLHALADMLLTTSVDYKLVVSVNQAYVYTNDLDLIAELDCADFLQEKTYNRAQIVRPKDTVQLKNPKHNCRSYLKSMNLSSQQRDNLENFLYNQREHLRTSPALTRWIDLPFNRTQDYYFIDHSGKEWITMINLVVPGVIRKTMQIIPAK